ncbi:hypothetical protein F5X99DRAFT_407707 [Biscogniauxia marginata]|nr:hypothetical protein F5X99DRAFT_407707 [Biscogniauxia marginata]
MDFCNTADYHGYTEINLNACLISLSTVIYGLRIYNRAFMTKTLGLDDGIATIAYLLLVVQSAMDINAVSFGSGAHISLLPVPLLSKFFNSLAIQILIYFWAVAMVRFAILAFLPRISNDKSTRSTSWVIAVVILAQTVTVVVYRLTECTPIGDNFKPTNTPGLHCVGLVAHNKMMVGHAAASVVIDLALLFLPIWVVYTKMMWSQRTVQIILILSVGFFVVITGIVRLILMVTLDFASDVTYQMATLGIWTNLEGHIGLWCGCFPALQPILRAALYRLGLCSKLANKRSNIMSKPDKMDEDVTFSANRGSRADSAGTLGSGSQRVIALEELTKDVVIVRDPFP